MSTKQNVNISIVVISQPSSYVLRKGKKILGGSEVPSELEELTAYRYGSTRLQVKSGLFYHRSIVMSTKNAAPEA